MKEEYIKWYSPNLGMDIEMLVYGHSGVPVVIFPTTMGRYYESKDFKLIESIQYFIDSGKVRVYCPDSIDRLSWYNKKEHPAKRVQNHIWYDKMIRWELVDRMRHDTGHSKIIAAGASFGKAVADAKGKIKDLDTLKATLPVIGKQCGGCHETYRLKAT